MRAGARRATILVVDDDVHFGTTLRRLLEADGHDVHQVLDGEEALRRVAALGSELKLVLLDLLLPRRTGFEVVKELGASGCQVPILVMTGVYDDAREIRALRTMGVRGWIHKSSPIEHFLFRVNGLLCPPREDSRQAHRVAISVPVQYSTCSGGSESGFGTSYNLSASGIYVRTSEILEPGTVIDMELSLPTSEQLVCVQAEVVHAASPEEVKGTAYPAGFGARFVGISPLALSAIVRLVDVVRAEEMTGELPATNEPVGGASRSERAAVAAGDEEMAIAPV